MSKFKICHKFLFYQVNIVFYQVKSVILPSDIMILPSDIMILPSDIMVLPNDWKFFISVNVEVFLRCDFATNWVLVWLIIVNLATWYLSGSYCYWEYESQRNIWQRLGNLQLITILKCWILDISTDWAEIFCMIVI